MLEINKIYYQNCIEVLKQLADGSVDAYIQDPPFEVTANEWDKGFIEMLPILWEIWIKKAKSNAPFIFKATFPFANDLINSRPKGMKYYEWVWKKNRYTNFVNTEFMPMRCIEYIFIFYKEKYTYNPILRENIQKKGHDIRFDNTNTKIYKIKNAKYEKHRTDFGSPVNFLEIASQGTFSAKDKHPNRTNPELWEYFIKTYTNEGDLIFDGYTGSGSVPQACIKTNRNFIACENSAEYFFETEKRILNTKEIKEHGYAKTELRTNQNSLFFGQVLERITSYIRTLYGAKIMKTLIVKRLRITQEQDSFLKEYCKKMGVPVNVWVRIAIDERIKKLNKKR